MIGSSIASDLGDFAEGAKVDIDAGVKDGYTFTEWHSDDAINLNDPTSRQTFFTMIAKAVTVTARWLINEDTRLKYCKTVVEAAIANKEWGWNDKLPVLSDLVNTTITDTDTEVTYEFIESKCEVTPSTNDTVGSIAYEVILKLNTYTETISGSIVLPVVPTADWEFTCTIVGSNAENSGTGKFKAGTVVTINTGAPIAGWEFIGWESNITLGDSAANTTTFTMPESDVTITAMWDKIDYTVTMDEHCDTPNPSPIYNVGDVVSISCSSAEFVEWSCDDPTVVFADKTSSTTTFTMPAGNVTIDHSYKTYTVTIDSDFATTGAGSYMAGQTVTLTTSAVAEYDFGGWSAGGGVEITNATELTATFTMPNTDVNVIASWELILYPITIVLQDLKATGYVNTDEISVGPVASGVAVTIDGLPGNYLDGYKFVDCVVASGTIDPNTAVWGETPAFRMPSEAVVLNYRRNKELTLNVVGVNGASEPEIKKGYLGDVIQLVAGNKTGATFRAWEMNPANSVTIADTSSNATSVTLKDQDATVSVGWDMITYTITTDVDCNTVTHADPLVYGETVSISCNNSKFVEWSCSDPTVVFADKTNANTTFVMPANNITIDHLFSSYDVIMTNAEDVGAGSYVPGSTVTITAGNKSGKEFVSWTCDDPTVVIANSTNRVTTFVMPSKDVTITSNWKDSYFTITSEGAVSASATLKALPSGSVDLVIPTMINGITVSSINTSAFASCASLKSVTMPDSVTKIGNNAFDNCTSLKSVTIGNNTSIIGSSAFYNCASLTSVSIPNSVTIIGASAFSLCAALTSINIPDSVTTIGASAFQNCKTLTSIDIPSAVRTISGWTFQGCTSLAMINIPSSVNTINASAFMNCTSLTSINIPSSVTKIDPYVFNNCTSLVSINIDKPYDSIIDSPWGAPVTNAVKWNLYNLTVTGGTGTGSVKPGVNATIVATTPSGKQFKGWKCATNNVPSDGTAITSEGIITTSASYTFAMPYGNVRVTAVFVDLHTVSVTGSTLPANQNGSGQYAEGATVTVKAGTPAAGMVFSGWECSTNNVTPL